MRVSNDKNETTGSRVASKGRSRSPEYTAWSDMRTRCANPNHANYSTYGGRGISVCERWDSFREFLSDMGRRPNRSYSLDRIDNSGNYCPENCRWATKREQTENRSVTIWITSGGRTLTQTQWSRELGGGLSLVRYRLKSGWTEEQAVTIPVGERRKPPNA